MTEKFRILAEYIKDISSETPDIETYLFVKENIPNYQLNIDIKLSDEVIDKKDLEKIVLCDVPTKIYPHLEKSFLNLVHDSGHPNIKLEKKVDFLKLYNERFN